MISQPIHEGNWFRKIIHHSKWYLLSNFLTKGISFLFLPIYAKYMSVEEFGALGGLQSIMAILPAVISLHIGSAFARYFHDVKANHTKTQKLVSTIFWFILLYGTVLVFLTILTSKFWLPNLLEVSIWPFATLAFISPLFLQLGFLGNVYLQANLKSRESTFLQTAYSLVNAVLILVLLIGLKWGLLAYLVGVLLASIFYFLCSTYIFMKEKLITFSLDLHLLKTYLAYSIPLIPSLAGIWIANLSDKLVIAKFLDLSDLAVYTVAYQIGMIPYVIHDVLTLAQGPMSLSGLIHEKEVTKLKIANFSGQIWVLMLIINLGLLLFSTEAITLLFSDDYLEAIYLIPIIGFSYVFGSQRRVYTVILSFLEKTWIISSAGVISAIINLGLNIVFVPIYGNYAAAVSTVISFLIYTIWMFYWCQKYEKIHYPYKKMTLSLVLFLLLAIPAIFLVDTEFDLIKLFLKIMLFGVFSAACYLLLRPKVRS